MIAGAMAELLLQGQAELAERNREVMRRLPYTMIHAKRQGRFLAAQKRCWRELGYLPPLTEEQSFWPVSIF